MKILCTIMLFAVMIGMVSCGDEQNDRFPGYEMHPSGVYFKKHKSGTGKINPSDSDYVLVSLRYTTEGDSVFNDNGGKAMPMMVMAPRYKGDFFELVRGMRVGDSVTFMMSVDSIREFYNVTEFPEYIDTNGFVGYAVRLDSVLTKATYQAEERKMMDLAKNDSVLLEKFIKEKNITAKPDEFGLYVIESVKGTGMALEPGMAVSVKYNGYYLDGSVFDNSDDLPNQALVFPLGMQRVIPGWDIGISRLRVGSKGMLIVPWQLGYRDGLTRVFDIEVVNAQAAPPAPKGPPGMPQAPAPPKKKK